MRNNVFLCLFGNDTGDVYKIWINVYVRRIFVCTCDSIYIWGFFFMRNHLHNSERANEFIFLIFSESFEVVKVCCTDRRERLFEGSKSNRGGKRRTVNFWFDL